MDQGQAKDRTNSHRAVVLVLEDEPAMLQMLALALSAIGVDVRTAANLGEARAHLDEGLDLVVLDFYVPPEVGTDLIDDIPAGIPILLLTGSIEPRQLQEKYSRISAVLRKPVRVADLESTVRGLLGWK